jgi:photosystem II stability/assembly factor-like uncharacterized protein
MPHTARRIVTLAAIALTTALAACTNPVAPASPGKVKAPSERPNLDGAYQGAVG